MTEEQFQALRQAILKAQQQWAELYNTPLRSMNLTQRVEYLGHTIADIARKLEWEFRPNQRGDQFFFAIEPEEEWEITGFGASAHYIFSEDKWIAWVDEEPCGIVDGAYFPTDTDATDYTDQWGKDAPRFDTPEEAIACAEKLARRLRDEHDANPPAVNGLPVAMQITD